VAKQLLAMVQGLLGTMWKGTQQGRSKIQDVIKDTQAWPSQKPVSLEAMWK
jgi:hypothetical protein